MSMSISFSIVSWLHTKLIDTTDYYWSLESAKLRLDIAVTRACTPIPDPLLSMATKNTWKCLLSRHTSLHSILLPTTCFSLNGIEANPQMTIHHSSCPPLWNGLMQFCSVLWWWLSLFTELLSHQPVFAWLDHSLASIPSNSSLFAICWAVPKCNCNLIIVVTQSKVYSNWITRSIWIHWIIDCQSWVFDHYYLI